MVAVTLSVWVAFSQDCHWFLCWKANEWHFCKFNLCFMLLLISLSHKDFILCSSAHLRKTVSFFCHKTCTHSVETEETLLSFPLGWFEEIRQLKAAVFLLCLHSCWAGTDRAQTQMCRPGHCCAHTKTPREIEVQPKRNSRVFSRYLRWGLTLAIVWSF